MSTPPNTTARVTIRLHRWLVLSSTGLLIVFLALSGLTYFRQDIYLASVLMEVKSSHAKPWHYSPWDDPHVFAAQLRSFHTKEILDPVIVQFDLVKHYGTAGESVSYDQAFDLLARALEVKRIGKSITIEVRDRDPHMTANIANLVSLIYRDQYMNTQFNTKAIIEELLVKLKQQRAEVDADEAVVVKIRQTSVLTDPIPEANHSPVLELNPDKEEAVATYTRAKARYLESKQVLSYAKARVAALQQEEYVAEPVYIWARAHPPSRPESRFRFRR